MIRVAYYKSTQVNMHLHFIGPLRLEFGLGLGLTLAFVIGAVITRALPCNCDSDPRISL